MFFCETALNYGGPPPKELRIAKKYSTFSEVGRTVRLALLYRFYHREYVLTGSLTQR